MPPTLVALKGHPGTGKSTLAAALARVLSAGHGMSATVVAKDDVREAMDACGGSTPDPAPPPRQAWLNAAANEAAIRVAGTALACGGVDVIILDTTLSCEAMFTRLCGVAAGAGVGRVVVVETCLGSSGDAADAAWNARLRGRAAHKPQDADTVRALIAGYSGRDGWAAERAGVRGGDEGAGPPVGPAVPLPLPWAAAGEVGGGGRTDAHGAYVRVATGRGIGPADLARQLVETVFVE